MTAPTDAERVAQIVRRVFPLKIAIGPCAIDCATAEEADEMESRLRSTISAALAAVRADERERAARIAEETDSDAFPRDDFPRMIADAIRRQEG